ncbi:MAG: hypothetical protein ACK56I_14885, partial [bacterium]
ITHDAQTVCQHQDLGLVARDTTQLALDVVTGIRHGQRIELLVRAQVKDVAAASTGLAPEGDRRLHQPALARAQTAQPAQQALRRGGGPLECGDEVDRRGVVEPELEWRSQQRVTVQFGKRGRQSVRSQHAAIRRENQRGASDRLEQRQRIGMAAPRLDQCVAARRGVLQRDHRRRL